MSREDRIELVPDDKAPIRLRGSLREFWTYFAVGAVLNILPFAAVVIARKSLAAKRGALTGCGINAMTIVVLLGASIWARTDYFIPTAQLAVLVVEGIVGPISISVGVSGFAKISGRRSSADFALGIISALLSFGVMIGAVVVLLIRGLWTSM